MQRKEDEVRGKGQGRSMVFEILGRWCGLRASGSMGVGLEEGQGKVMHHSLKQSVVRIRALLHKLDDVSSSCLFLNRHS